MVDLRYNMVLTTKDIENVQKELYQHSLKQAKKKGNDYSGDSEDTFRNIRSAKYFGVVKSDAQACMVQILNKVARMSNQSEPGFIAQIKDESIFDTVSDLWNYSSYWLLLMRESKDIEIKNEIWKN